MTCGILVAVLIEVRGTTERTAALANFPVLYSGATLSYFEPINGSSRNFSRKMSRNNALKTCTGIWSCGEKICALQESTKSPWIGLSSDAVSYNCSTDIEKWLSEDKTYQKSLNLLRASLSIFVVNLACSCASTFFYWNSLACKLRCQFFGVCWWISYFLLLGVLRGIPLSMLIYVFFTNNSKYSDEPPKSIVESDALEFWGFFVAVFSESLLFCLEFLQHLCRQKTHSVKIRGGRINLISSRRKLSSPK